MFRLGDLVKFKDEENSLGVVLKIVKSNATLDYETRYLVRWIDKVARGWSDIGEIEQLLWESDLENV